MGITKASKKGLAKLAQTHLGVHYWPRMGTPYSSPFGT